MALRIPTVDIAIPLFLFILPHVSPRPPRRRRGLIYRARAHEHPQNGVAIRNISYIKTDRKKREANP